ncbi:MAG: 30S ribosomal protein S9 [Thermoplasmata archaeon]|nr:MAG: 30S ribosomal protein S9 [Thermoplasmata archaeon]HDO69284.1 30S ribosomal protein S9 [Thermoplasmatales archaeon]HEX17199.1 30S ribosomal protein S9 [Thermoplasmatales archaeon]
MSKVVVASGKKKTAIARAYIRKGKGRVRINNIPLEIYQPEVARWKIMEPLVIAKKYWKNLDIDVNVHGGGVMGHAYAVRTAIAKGLVEFTGDEQLKEIYLKFDRNLLVSDPRRKEPKKPLGRGARKKRQKSYR